MTEISLKTSALNLSLVVALGCYFLLTGDFARAAQDPITQRQQEMDRLLRQQRLDQLERDQRINQLQYDLKIN